MSMGDDPVSFLVTAGSILLASYSALQWARMVLVHPADQSQVVPTFEIMKEPVEFEGDERHRVNERR